MSSHVANQISAIHTMLTAGHRHLRIERHTLGLWGLTGASLFAASESILTPAQFPANRDRAIAWFVLLSVVIGTVAAIDWFLTKRAKHARDEALSFLHRQVLKVWWLLLAMGVLTTFAMFFVGGGVMLNSVWVVLIGLGLYVHGLFSEEFVEWAGAITIVIGICGQIFRLDYEATRWIAASVFGVGLPLLALMLDRGRSRPFWRRLGQAVVWTIVVLTPPLALEQVTIADPLSEVPMQDLAAFQAGPVQPGRSLVALPAGSVIPVELALDGNLFRPDPALHLNFTLDKPVELVVENGIPTGDVRVGDGIWHKAFGRLSIHIPLILAGFTAERSPIIRSRLELQFETDRAR
jgi:hypothetical protein